MGVEVVFGCAAQADYVHKRADVEVRDVDDGDKKRCRKQHAEYNQTAHKTFCSAGKPVADYVFVIEVDFLLGFVVVGSRFCFIIVRLGFFVVFGIFENKFRDFSHSFLSKLVCSLNSLELLVLFGFFSGSGFLGFFFGFFGSRDFIGVLAFLEKRVVLLVVLGNFLVQRVYD